MADTIEGQKIKELDEATSASATDDLIIEDDTPKTRRISFSNLVQSVREAMSADLTMIITGEISCGLMNEESAGITTAEGYGIIVGWKTKVI